MNIEHILFRYIRQPHKFSTYSATPRTCDLCEEVGAGYEGPFYGERDTEFVCEACLVTGKLRAAGLSTNEGDVAALRKQLTRLYPQWTSEQREALCAERTAELERRTPHLITWQDFFWPVHCGDYCCFLKEVGQPDFNSLAPEGTGKAFFIAHLYPGYERTDLDYLWESVRPDSPQDSSDPYSTGVYLFQCLHCEEYVILWDCD